MTITINMQYLSLKIPGPSGTTVGITPPPGIPSGEQFTLGVIASYILTIALTIGILLSLFYLIYGGIYWLQASGDKTKWDKARRIIIYSLFGLFVMSFSLIAVNVIGEAFGVKTIFGK